jgi:hypothetical protein
MGDYADMEMDRMAYWDDRRYEEDCKKFPIYPNPIFNTWTDVDGNNHEVKEMTELHLNNCIRMLSRGNSPLKDGYIKSMKKELERRNKMNVGQYNIPGYVADPNYATSSEPVPQEVAKISNVDLKVVGVTFTNEDGSSRREAIMEMTDESTVELVREPSNKYDINAIKVITGDKQIGYIGKEYASIMAPLMDTGTQFTAVVRDYGEFKSKPYCEIRINQL